MIIEQNDLYARAWESQYEKPLDNDQDQSNQSNSL